MAGAEVTAARIDSDILRGLGILSHSVWRPRWENPHRSRASWWLACTTPAAAL